MLCAKSILNILFISTRASTVLRHLIEAYQKYGIPSRIRSDRGGENVVVALFINLGQTQSYSRSDAQFIIIKMCNFGTMCTTTHSALWKRHSVC